MNSFTACVTSPWTSSTEPSPVICDKKSANALPRFTTYIPPWNSPPLSSSDSPLLRSKPGRLEFSFACLARHQPHFPAFLDAATSPQPSSWEAECNCFLHLPDVSRVLFTWVRLTFSSNSSSSCMHSGNPYTRLHFFPSSIPSLIFLSSKLIFKSLGTSTFSSRQSFTNSAWGYVWSLDFSRKTSSKDMCWNPNFWHKRAHCVFLSIPRAPVSRLTSEVNEIERMYQWRRL